MSEKGSQSTHIEKKVSRREFLKFAGVVLAAGATGVLGYVLGEGNRATEPTSTLTPTPEPTITQTPTSTPTPESTATTEPISRLNEPVVNQYEGLTIEGVPDQISPTQLRKWANEPQPAPGDVGHINTIGLNTEGWLAEPGVLTANSQQDCGNNPSCWELTPGRQQILTNPDGSVWPLNEDGFALISGATMDFEVNGISVHLPRLENHGWLVVIKGMGSDGQIGTDNNLSVKISKYDPGFTLVTMLPPGQFVSEGYFLQNAAAAQGNYDGNRDPSGCGRDGCRRVSAFFVDVETGAYTVITRDNPDGRWQPVATNIR